MPAHPWDEVESLFDAAVGLTDAERARLLDARCAGQPSLRQEIDSLLASHDRSGDFLRAPIEASASAPGLVGLDGAGAPATTDHASRSRADTGRLVGHYQLVEWLAAGGMGDVFRAHDLALGREAAVKLLLPDFGADFRRALLAEAEASARLQHPAIATFYEAGEADGETYIAMEYVRGRTLRDRLRDGPLPTDEAVSIATCLLEALAHAHLAGLVHRDIKPDNVMVVEGGVAKLLDFGIALPFQVKAPAANAQDGNLEADVPTCHSLVGTPGYLAPEQVAGGPIDARTDLFQVGVVLYEMVTGRPAFRPESLREALKAAMTATLDLDALQDDKLPAALCDMIRRAVARDPQARYDSASAFLRDLRTVGGAHPARTQALIAVADFENLTGDHYFDWVGSAVAEGLHASLAALLKLKLIARRRFLQEVAEGDKDRDSVAAALRLGCHWLVCGEIQPATDGAIRFVARLYDVTAGCLRATHDVSGPLDALFTVQQDLTAALAAELSDVPLAVGRPAHGITIAAHEYFTRARLLVEGFGKGSLEDARELLERAIALDDGHVGALGALAAAYGLRAIARPNAADYEQAVAYADRALAVDPRHLRSWVWKSYALAGLGRHPEAERAVHKALEIDAGDTEALYFTAGVKLFWKNPPQSREAIELLQRAVATDERRGMWWLALGAAHRCLNRHREALYSFERALRLEGQRSPFNTAGVAAYIGETLRRGRCLEPARTSAFAGLEAAERSDHAYRDTFRAHALTVIGRIALDERDGAAAAAAFGQVLAQARGRPHPRACGHFVVQALCGMARATHDRDAYEQAARLLEARDTYNFDPFHGALESDTVIELARAADAVGARDESGVWLARAHAAGWRDADEPAR